LRVCGGLTGAGGASKAGRGPAGRREEEGESFFDARKKELAESAAATAAALAKVRPRVQGGRGRGCVCWFATSVYLCVFWGGGDWQCAV
jgi:hypothetical protein